MNSCHVLPGRFDAVERLAGRVGHDRRALAPVPTQTAALTWGVKPTIHASLFVGPVCLFGLAEKTPSVPVLAADTRPFGEAVAGVASAIGCEGERRRRSPPGSSIARTGAALCW